MSRFLSWFWRLELYIEERIGLAFWLLYSDSAGGSNIKPMKLNLIWTITGLFNVLMLELSRVFCHGVIQNGDAVISVFKNYCINAARSHAVKAFTLGGTECSLVVVPALQSACLLQLLLPWSQFFYCLSLCLAIQNSVFLWGGERGVNTALNIKIIVFLAEDWKRDWAFRNWVLYMPFVVSILWPN